MRREGYSLVGIEQTAQSQRITEYRFHRKTILVLGYVRTFLLDGWSVFLKTYSLLAWVLISCQLEFHCLGFTGQPFSVFLVLSVR